MCVYICIHVEVCGCAHPFLYTKPNASIRLNTFQAECWKLAPHLASAMAGGTRQLKARESKILTTGKVKGIIRRHRKRSAR